MKNCIIAFLLGFDEIDSFQLQYSTSEAFRKDFSFPSIHSKDTHQYPYDKLTIFESHKHARRQPRYRICIAISLIEPYPGDIQHAHLAIFKFVQTHLRRNVPNWWENLKIIVKHHSANGENKIWFDPRLLQNLLVPGTYKGGFHPHIPDPRHPETMLSPETAKTLSDNITARVKKRVPLGLLANWIVHCLPPTHLQLWGADNPLRMTLGGCYTGAANVTWEALIHQFAYEMAQQLPNQFIVIIGAINWTFYGDWRTISPFQKYLERSNPDPFRGTALPHEEDFFVKTPPNVRRAMTRVVSIIPKTDGHTEIFYHARPLKGDVPYTPTLIPQIERLKINILNQSIEIFLKLNKDGPHLHVRIPEQIKTLILMLNAGIQNAFTEEELNTAIQYYLKYLKSMQRSFRKKVGQTVPGMHIHIDFILKYIIDMEKFLNTMDIPKPTLAIQHTAEETIEIENEMRRKLLAADAEEDIF